MPTTYAHYRFGKYAKNSLPSKERETVLKYRGLFDIGLHGPDIFFYYKAYHFNPVNRFGYDMHARSMSEFLNDIRPIYQESNNKEPLLAYILGFVAHFALDSYCHGYVERKSELMPLATHTRIETQLDRYFLIKDGKDPIKTSVSRCIRPSKKKARYIAALFPVFDEDIIYKVLRDMKFYLDIFTVKNPVSRKAMTVALTVSGNKNRLHKLMDYEEYDYCKDSNLRLEKLFDAALLHYDELAIQTVLFLNEGSPLSDYFDYNFGPKPDYKDIPVLGYEEELEYVFK